jgi:hypothetical protein
MMGPLGVLVDCLQCERSASVSALIVEVNGYRLASLSTAGCAERQFF